MEEEDPEREVKAAPKWRGTQNGQIEHETPRRPYSIDQNGQIDSIKVAVEPEWANRAQIEQGFRIKSRLHIRASEIEVGVNTRLAIATLPARAAWLGALRSQAGMLEGRQHIKVHSARGIRPRRSEDWAIAVFSERLAEGADWVR